MLTLMFLRVCQRTVLRAEVTEWAASFRRWADELEEITRMKNNNVEKAKAQENETVSKL